MVILDALYGFEQKVHSINPFIDMPVATVPGLIV
jgi:hypothetical protein